MENNDDLFTIRTSLQVGDVSSIGLMHAKFYGEEYSYSLNFEKYILECLCEFIENYDATTDCLWIAEHNGEILGSIGIIGNTRKPQLRWFLVDQKYRGLGVGKKTFRVRTKFL